MLEVNVKVFTMEVLDPERDNIGAEIGLIR
jgi:hypothetical protein